MSYHPSHAAFIDRLQPAPVGGGFAMDGWWVWCGSAIRGEDGRYHLFASRWPRKLPFAVGYPLRSEIVRAVADKPEGPYTFAEVVLPARGEAFWDGRMTHNPTIHFWRGTYYLFYIGATYAGPTPADHDPLDKPEDKIRRGRSWFNIRIGIATAPRPEGPWTRFDKPAFDVRPEGWDRFIVTNPAPCIRDDGKTLLIYRTPGAIHALLGAAGADHPLGPYKRLSLQPVFEFHPTEAKFVEDPYVWWNGDRYEMIAKDLSGNLTGEYHSGVHATSRDGLDWRVSDPPKAYSRNILWSDGTRTTQGSFERPQLLFHDGRPTHLFAATADGPGGFDRATRTWNMVVPIG